MGKKSEQYQQPPLTLKIKYKNDHDIYWGNINILAWNMHNYMAGLNWEMGSQPSLDIRIFIRITDRNKQ